MAEILGIDQDEVLGKLLRFWSWCDQQLSLRSCTAVSVTETFIDRVCYRNGFAQALIEVGWLDATDDGISIPNFDHHLSKSAKSRAQTQKRVRKSRNAPSVTEALPEKRREESIIPTPHNGREIPKRPSLEEAQSTAPMAGVTPKEAESWWMAREANDWLKGTAGGNVTPVGRNWQADLKRFTETERNRNREKGKRPNGRARNRNTGTANDGTARATAPRPPGV
jgi:hypothetical protein